MFDVVFDTSSEVPMYKLYQGGVVAFEVSLINGSWWYFDIDEIPFCGEPVYNDDIINQNVSFQYGLG